MLPVDIPDPAQNTLRGHGAGSIGSVIEEAGGVSDGINDRLSVSLERREIPDIESSNQLPIQIPAILRSLRTGKEEKKKKG